MSNSVRNRYEKINQEEGDEYEYDPQAEFDRKKERVSRFMD